MSYSICITDPQTGEILEVATPHHLYGGTFRPNETELKLNITYNYNPFYYRKNTLGESTRVYGMTPVNGALPVLREEYGGIPGLEFLSIREARQRVLNAIDNLADADIDADGNPCTEDADSYWAPTEKKRSPSANQSPATALFGSL